MTGTDIAILALGVIASLLGILGTILPAIPGLPLLAAGLVLLAWAGDFLAVGGVALAVIVGLAFFGMAIDFVAGLLGAKVCGASKQALWGAFIGGLVGIVFGLPGLILGPFVGAAVGELMAQRGMWQAGKVGLATLLGLIIGTVAKIGSALAMVGVFVGAYLV